MHAKRWTVGLMAVGLLAGEAAAQDFSELAELKVPAAPGVATATPAEPTWCKGEAPQGVSAGGVRQLVETATRDFGYVPRAMALLCVAPKDANIQKGVALLAQAWMNETGLTQARALEVLALRAQEDKLRDEKKKLCDALVVDAETEGEEKSFMQARRALFGCNADAPLWMDGDSLGGVLTDPYVEFLDASATPPDQAVLMSHVIQSTRFLFGEKSSYFDSQLTSYVTVQVDLAAIAEAKALELLGAAPYKDNAYARVVLLESLARTQLAGVLYQKALEAKGKDAAWKELLVTAPAKGIADWNKLAAANQDVLARSNAFEAKFFGPSRSALKGCWKTLKADFVSVLKALPRATEFELESSANEPLPALLLTRLAACAKFEQDPAYSSLLLNWATKVRPSRGPRTAAYYAALAALGTIAADRPKFPVKPSEFRYLGDQSLLKAAADSEPHLGDSKLDSMGFVMDKGEGTVQAVKKSGANVVITFVPTKGQFMSHNCQNTGRIQRITADGEVIYERRCVETGWVTVNTTPAPFTATAEWAEGIKPGTVVRFDATRGNGPERWGMPLAAYADKSKKKLVTYLGIAF